LEIWERGAGYTLASGSSASAAAAVTKRLGLCDSNISVHMPGGVLRIAVSDDFSIQMTGPVTKVAEGIMSQEIFDTLLLKQDIKPPKTVLKAKPDGYVAF
jgi:diaminopimelate epimerase